MVSKRHGRSKQPPAADERLLHALANQIKTPLMQIARLAELAHLQDTDTHLTSITTTAEAALSLVDSYLLSTQLLQGQQSLDLEPVTVSAVMYDAAQQLAELARDHHCELELDISGKYGPVMAHRQGLEAALVSLGYVFIEAQSQQDHTKRPVLKIGAHKAKQGIVTGVFTHTEALSATMFARAGVLYGRARQPLSNFTAGSGAGVFVADSIFSAMSTKLRLAHHHRLVGLAATLTPSNQLQLV